MVPAKRAMLYITRKKGKTLSLFLTVFVIAVLLFSGFGVLCASNRLAKDVRSSVGAAFYIRATNRFEETQQGCEVKTNGTHITEKNINEIMKTGDIRYCNPINYGYAKSDAIKFIPGDWHSDDIDMGNVTALSYSALADDFTNKTSQLVKGRHFTDKDTAKILISDKLAQKNSLGVGDTVTLTHAGLGIKDNEYFDDIPVKTQRVKAEITGIYKTQGKSGDMQPTARLAENRIYASQDILVSLKESEKGIYTGEVGFYINDPAQLNSIVSSVRGVSSINWDDHFIRTNDLHYSKIAGKLSSISDLVSILIVLVAAVSTALLTLMLTLRIRGRMNESGILLAAGISKREIVSGFMIEVMTVTAAALLLSFAASQLFAGIIGESLFKGLDPDLLNGETIVSGSTKSRDIAGYMRLDAVKTVLIYLCQASTVAAATLVSSITILRLKPKDILSRMS